MQIEAGELFDQLPHRVNRLAEERPVQLPEVQDQIESAVDQPIGEVLTDLLIRRVAQVSDAPTLDRDNLVQAVVAFQGFDRRLNAEARHGCLRQDLAQPVEEGQLHHQIADAVPQAEQDVGGLKIHSYPTVVVSVWQMCSNCSARRSQ